MGSGFLGTNIGNSGFFGFDPTPDYSVVRTVNNMAAGNFNVAPDGNAAPQVQGAATTEPAFDWNQTGDTNRLAPTTSPDYQGAYTGSTAGPTEAQVAAQTARNNAMNAVNVGRDNTMAGGQTELSSGQSTYDTNQRKWVNGITDRQNALNNDSANNQLNLRRSMSSIAGGIRQGLRSGGVQLANMGASDSGAAMAMANAYGQEGNGLANDANNQAALADQQILASQGILNRDRNDGVNDFGTWKTTETNRIANNLKADLGTLNVDAQKAGVAGVDVGMVDQLVNNALVSFANIDTRTAGELAKISGLTPEQALAKAAEMDQAGAAGRNPFAVAGVDMFQNANPNSSAGAPISQIPLTINRRRDY